VQGLDTSWPTPYTQTRIHIHTHKHAYTYTLTNTHTHTNSQTRIYIHTHKHTYTHKHAYTYILTNTHTHTHSQTRIHIHACMRRKHILHWAPWRDLTSVTGPNTVGVSLRSPEEGNRSSFRNVVFSSCLEFRTTDNVHKPSNSECCAYR
jgi:hypothetical protein